MRKIGMYVMSGLVLLALSFVNVKALTFTNSDGNGKIESGENYEVTTGEDTKTHTIKLKKDVALDFVFEDGEIVTLDLNGYKLTNYCTTCSPIFVKSGASLTIIDSKGNDGKTGIITYKDESTSSGDYYASLIRNEGSLELAGGLIDVSKGAESANTKPYAIGIDNLKTLKVTDGEVKTSHKNAWGINNQVNATTEISGGTFTQGADFSVIMNHGDMTISNGTFGITENNTEANSLISSIGTEEKDASLNVSGGNFTGNNNVFYENADEEVYGGINITGGKYKLTAEGATLNLSKYISDEYEVDENGNVTAKVPEVVVKPPKDKSPKTGTVSYALVVSLMTLLSATGIVMLKKSM